MNDAGATETVPVAELAFDAMQVQAMIPHRYPFLMIDRVRHVRPDHGAVGIKCVSMGEPFFQGHFPERPVMPGVLIVEAIAQTAAVVVMATLGESAHGKLVYFMSVDTARFRKPVGPGDTLELEVLKRHRRGPVWRFDGVARVAGVTVAEATVTAMIVDNA